MPWRVAMQLVTGAVLRTHNQDVVPSSRFFRVLFKNARRVDRRIQEEAILNVFAPHDNVFCASV